MNFRCEKCNYFTNIKCNYIKHLKTNKHKKCINISGGICSEKGKKYKKPSQTLTKSINSLTTHHKMRREFDDSINFDNDNNDNVMYKCFECGKEFTRQDNLKRHYDKYCNKVNEFTKIINSIKSDHKKEKDLLKKQIEILLTKVGNTTNNTTINNTIILNNYGNEDLSHISDSLKSKLLKIPYAMIPKMIEHVHFNDEKPENKNIVITNSRDNKLKIYKNNKWIYKDKIETLNDLVDNKYYILDTFFETEHTKNQLNDVQKDNYKKFRELIDNGDKNLIENIKKDCEIILLNNR